MGYTGHAVVSGGGGASSSYDLYTVDPTIRSNKQVPLSAEPLDPLKVELVVFNGPEQLAGVDFVVTGTTLSWDGLALELILEDDDIFAVRYNY